MSETNQPSNKCPHGCYIPTIDGGETSRYCSACNPDILYDGLLTRAMKAVPVSRGGYAEPHTPDVAEYMLQSPNERLAAAQIDL